MKQTDIVLKHLREFGWITPMVAEERYGIRRLAAVIWKLRHKRGFTILDKLETGLNRFGVKTTYSKYYLP